MADVDPQSRRSRLAWPIHTREATTPAGTHSHQLPRAWLSAFLGLTATVIVLLGVMLLLVWHVQSLTQYRNQQDTRTRDELRHGFCDLLDQLPASAVLDGPRKRYGCGPGIPVSQLPPTIRKGWSPPAAATVARPSTDPRPTRAMTAPASAATVTAPPPTEAPKPTHPGATPTPTAPRLLDPLLCHLTGVCTEVP